MAGPAHPVTPRDAATVVVLRQAGGGPQVLLLRRSSRSRFAPDQWVFPGGAVDAADRTLDPACWTGIDPVARAGVLGLDPAAVPGAHVAAVRETYEEAGLLFATTPAARPPGRDFHADVARAGLVLDLGALTPFARWVTPESQPRRFDTVFFVAWAPDGQVARHDRFETVGQRWVTPGGALAEAAAGTLALMYPTQRTLSDLAGLRDAREFVARANALRRIRRIQPRIAVRDGEARVLHPDDPDYGLP